MKTKWDIVDDVVSSQSEEWVPSKPLRRAKLLMKNGLATTVFAGSLLLPRFAVSETVVISPGNVCASSTKQPGIMKMKSEFVRPRGSRETNPPEHADATVGLSTRRLAELHTKLFRPDDSVEAELTGEYNFL